MLLPHALPLLAATDTSDDIAKGADAFWTMWHVPITVAGIIVGAIVLRIIIHFVIRRVVDQVVGGVKRKQNIDDTQALSSPLKAVRIVQRTRTLGSVLNNIASVVIVVIAFASILGELDVSVVGVVSAAGVIAAGLAFGAQNIVKDLLSGLFMVFEDQLGVGDIVDVQLATGVVEAVGIRVTQVRDVNGTLWFVRNGEILRVGNMSQGWARAIIDVAVPYEVDVDEVESTILKTSVELRQQPRWKTRMLEKPELWGLQSISDSHLIVRLAVRTRSADKDAVSRELRIRIAKALDAKGIQLPSLQSVVLSGFEEATNVRGARTIETEPTPVQGPGRGRGRRGARRSTWTGGSPSTAPLPTTPPQPPRDDRS